MSDLSEKYKSIIDDIEKNIKGKEDLEYVKDKVADISMLFIDIIDRMTELTEMKMSNIEEKQEKIEAKLLKLDKSVSGIEKDIYADDNYDFEIVCPYCNNEFVADYMSENDIVKEIQCPECKNIIELDWNGDPSEEDDDEVSYGGCSGSCSSCGGCDSSDEDDDNDEDDDM